MENIDLALRNYLNKKSIMVLFLLLVMTSTVFGQQIVSLNNTYYSFETSITFDNGKIKITDLDVMTGKLTITLGTYTVVEEGKVFYIYVAIDNGKSEKWLAIYNNDLCYLYKNNSFPFFEGYIGSSRQVELFFPYAKHADASSYLIEGATQYRPDNLSNVTSSTSLGLPWVEGVPGQGIGEFLLLKTNETKKLFISNGFVSYDKPYLYNDNSRPKKIRLSVEGKFSFDAELEDTPNFQKIELPQTISRTSESEDVLKLEILDVYPGTKYDDTCINFIIFKM